MYGITNCDTIKTARAWLSEHGIAYRFVDFKKTPPTSQYDSHDHPFTRRYGR
jgi:arsenate reductase